MQPVYLLIKGTRYYEAKNLFKSGHLRQGTAVILESQPDNPHDDNAVSVKEKETRLMLGHLSRSIAPKYRILIKKDCITESTIHYVKNDDDHLAIKIRLMYEFSSLDISSFWPSASSLPTTPGIYCIHNILTNRRYIGSSKNIKLRIMSHFHDLYFSCHSNNILQSDFSSGPKNFEVSVIYRNLHVEDLALREALWIENLLSQQFQLYNMTVDGQGIYKRGGDKNKSTPSLDGAIRKLRLLDNPDKKDKKNKIKDFSGNGGKKIKENNDSQPRSKSAIKTRDVEKNQPLFFGFDSKDDLMRAIFDRNLSLDTLKRVRDDAPFISFGFTEFEMLKQAIRRAEQNHKFPTSSSNPDGPVKSTFESLESISKRYQQQLENEQACQRQQEINQQEQEQLKEERQTQIQLVKEQQRQDKKLDANDNIKKTPTLPFGASSIDELTQRVVNGEFSHNELIELSKRGADLGFRWKDFEVIREAFNRDK